jgi:hypothetical protein
MPGGGIRAGLDALAIMKAKNMAMLNATTWLARDEKDFEDFKFLLLKMEEMNEGFGVLLSGNGEIGDLEALTTAGEDVGGAHQALLLEMLGL